MIFSSTIAGVDQSMLRSTRKPRLNQDENRWTKSSSTAVRSSRWSGTSISCSRMRTSAPVPPGARYAGGLAAAGQEVRAQLGQTLGAGGGIATPVVATVE